MMQQTVLGSQVREEVPYPAPQRAWTLLVVPILVGMLLLSSRAMAADKLLNEEFVEGNRGALHVYGVLTESACRLDMASVFQSVSLGEVGTGHLQTVGAQGTPVEVQLLLRDCLRASSGNRDEQSGSLSWSTSQPAVSVTFLAESDLDNPQLIKVNGVSGLALRLSDMEQRTLQLGARTAPILLTSGNDVLTYYVTPVRTSAILRSGSYNANVDFRLSYD